MAGEKKEQQDEFAFITEKVMEQSIRRKRWMMRILGTFILAIIFGTTAAVSFVLVLPYIQAKFPKEEERESITIPRDELPTMTPIQIEESDITQEEISTTEPIIDIVENVLAERTLTIEDFNSLYEAIYQVVEKVNQSIVTVISVESEIDWFNNPYESKGETSGLIFNKTDTEILILTDIESIHSADDIRVTFENGKECGAILRKADIVSGIAILAINTEEFTTKELQAISTAVLGNSYITKPGDIAIAVGSPLGDNYSMTYGVISSIKNIVQTTDANYKILSTNIVGSKQGKGFLINTKGEVIGILTKLREIESREQIVEAIAISDMKGIIEKLSNGIAISYFGIKGQEITTELEKETKRPQGIYVTEAIVGSPVYKAGIQSGDVIVALGETEVKTMKTLRNLLDNYELGDVIKVTVKRQGREEEKTIVFDVILETQK